MDQASLRVLHIVSARRWCAEDATPSGLIGALRLQSGLHNQLALVADDDEDVPLPDDHTAILDHRTQSLARRLRTLDELAVARPDVVHTYGCREGLLGAYVAFRARCMVLRSVNGEAPDPGGWHNRLFHAADELCERIHVNVVCASPELGAQLASRHRRLCVSVIEPGVDVRALDAQAAQAVDGERLGPGFHVAFAGPITQGRRLDMALASAWVLARDHPGRFHFHVFGEGETRTTCEDFVQRHRLHDSVTFHGRVQSLAPWLARMNALLWCADQGVPTPVIEAMVLGIPVVANAGGGLAQLLGFGAYGTLVQDHAPYAYAAALATLDAQGERSRRRAANARLHARSRYDLARVAERYAMLYHSLAAARQRHSLGVCYL